MKNVLVRLQEYQAQASGAEKGLVAYFLEKPQEALTQSVRQLAEVTFTSPATVVRLCRKIGFQGYKDFQQSLLYEMSLREEGQRQLESGIREEDDLEEIVNKVTYKNIITLEDTRKLVDLEALGQCVDLLEASRCVYLFGIGASFLAAKDFQLKLLRVGKPCQLCEDWHTQLVLAHSIGAADMAVVFSYSGQTQEMLDCAGEIKKRGAPLVALTRFEKTPLVRLADHCLTVATTEKLFRSSAMASRIAQLNLIDILYTAYINRDRKARLERVNATHIERSRKG